LITLRFVEQEHGVFAKLMGVAQYGLLMEHCEAKTEQGTYIGAHLLGGVQEKKPGYDAGFKAETFVNLKTIPAQEVEFFSFLRAHLGEPYDPIAVGYFWGLFSGKNWQDPNAWTCSEFIASGLISCGWLPINAKIPSIRLTPRDLYYLTSTLQAMGEANV